MDAMPRCAVGKKGRHHLMAFFVDGDRDVPITLICEECGMTRQHPIDWALVGETLDNKSAAAILEATRPQ